MHYFTLLLGVAAVATIITAVPVVKERERLAVILDGRIANAGQALHECTIGAAWRSWPAPETNTRCHYSDPPDSFLSYSISMESSSK